ncbi:MAG: hypothetical protein VKK63_09490 [Synechococcus sp.]|nr:hypothetical protein [Synechococcus sp.]
MPAIALASPRILIRPRILIALSGAALLAGMAAGGAARAQQKGYGQTISSPQQERELDYGTGPTRSGSLMDSANPIELMNKLRKASSLDDATQPGDAVDAALRDFNSQSASPAATVKSP